MALTILQQWPGLKFEGAGQRPIIVLHQRDFADQQHQRVLNSDPIMWNQGRGINEGRQNRCHLSFRIAQIHSEQILRLVGYVGDGDVPVFVVLSWIPPWDPLSQTT